MKRREKLGVDLTPIIDVVFILLIFFIVTSVFKKDELALILNLPTSGAKAVEIEEKVAIELSKDSLALKGQKLTFAMLDISLSDIKEKDRAIIVRIDKDVKYERVVKVLDILQKHNLSNLALVTDEK
jgi:biopolymer transport protein ExbD